MKDVTNVRHPFDLLKPYYVLFLEKKKKPSFVFDCSASISPFGMKCVMLKSTLYACVVNKLFKELLIPE
jgi:hypothetical protein